MLAFQMGGLHYNVNVNPALADWYDHSLWCTCGYLFLNTLYSVDQVSFVDYIPPSTSPLTG